MTMKLSKADKDKVKSIRKTIDKLYLDIIAIKDNKNKSENDYKVLLKSSKEIVKQLNLLQKYGYKTKLWAKYVDPSYWEYEMNKHFGISKLTSNKNVKEQKIESAPKENLYYMMLCWSVTPNYFVCESVIEIMKSYFEKLKSKINIEFMDCMSDEFPDRIEYICTYKVKTTPEVYETILSSAEYILDSHSSSTYEKCNIGVFGKKIQ